MQNYASTLTKAQSTNLVRRLLAGQDWALVDVGSIADDVWRQTAEPRTADRLQSVFFRQYAAVLHHHCQNTGTAEQERAWYELRTWLTKHVQRLESHPTTQEEIVQETLLILQKALPDDPKAFLTFALQILRRQQIDLHRRRTADKRGSGQIYSLDALDNENIEIDNSWVDSFSALGANWRTIEDAVADQEIHHQLHQFAKEHLPTELQVQVFDAHFLDGLKPVEVAQYLGRKPHEIRLIKARIVNKMKFLPPPAKQQFLDILGKVNADE